ncbi:hypothetical protein ABZ819_04910 [Streptomyces venezuelae]|uniref:hypothetical protein n=1 Tax=Streptomyces venezuelae TaxID=54571 RepID=UPI0034227E89
MSTIDDATKKTPAYRELVHWVSGRVGDEEKADGYAERLYQRITEDAINVEHLKQRAEATNAALLEEHRNEVSACRAVLRALMSFAGGRDDDTARRVYATIARFNLGEMFRPGGGMDRWPIPVELTGQDETVEQAEAA